MKKYPEAGKFILRYVGAREFIHNEVVIPPKKNRKKQRQYDKDIYENRHHVENTFLKLKQWRGIATRYAKKSSSFIASVQICAMFMWLYIL